MNNRLCISNLGTHEKKEKRDNVITIICVIISVDSGSLKCLFNFSIYLTMFKSPNKLSIFFFFFKSFQDQTKEGIYFYFKKINSHFDGNT